MAEFTPVLPASMYRILDKVHGHTRHFLHAPQVVGRHGHDIVRMFKDKSCTVILDCFAFEHPGVIPDAQAVFEAATILRDEVKLIIVCPDVMCRPDLTMDMLRQYGPALGGYGRLMLVPHGTNVMEWMHCCEYMVDFCVSMGIGRGEGRPYIGLPRYITDWGMEMRHYLACWIAMYFPCHPVHLLGAGNGLAEVLGAASVPNVVSADSTLPFAWTYVHGSLYDDPTAKVEMPDEAWTMQGLYERTDLIRYTQLNIAIWKERLSRASPHVCF